MAQLLPTQLHHLCASVSLTAGRDEFVIRCEPQFVTEFMGEQLAGRFLGIEDRARGWGSPSPESRGLPRGSAASRTLDPLLGCGGRACRQRPSVIRKYLYLTHPSQGISNPTSDVRPPDDVV